MPAATLDAAPSRLQDLITARSKHCDYQLLHPSLAQVAGSLPQPVGKHEAQRQRFMQQHLSLQGLSVLDIGANTGYFSFAALSEGASKVIAQEGNVEHAQFIALAGQELGCTERLEVRPRYYGFDDPDAQKVDVVLCLNVLHHLGDDFGDPHLDLAAAKQHMLQALNHLATHCRHCWFQLGFNWKGDRHRPLFTEGTKAELIEFIRQGTAQHWVVSEVAVVDAQSRDYVPLNRENLARVDALGEFLNRPLFLLRSRLR